MNSNYQRQFQKDYENLVSEVGMILIFHSQTIEHYPYMKIKSRSRY